MAVYKRGAVWWIECKKTADGIRERGPVKKYEALWPAGEPLPSTKAAAARMEHEHVWPWIRRGMRQDELQLKLVASNGQLVPHPGAEQPADTPKRKTISDACQDYWDKHLSKQPDKGKGQLKVIQRQPFASQDVMDLTDAALVREFLGDIEEQREPSTRNRYMSRWMALLSWCRIEYKKELPDLFLADSPFHSGKDGISKLPESGRTRRISKAEERALLKGISKLPKDIRHMMLGRFYCALDTCLRRGEMLALTEDCIQDEPGTGLVMVVKWQTAKTKKQRKVVVATKRLRQWLKTRTGKRFTFGTLEGKQQDTFREDWEKVLLLSGLEAGHWSAEKQTANGGTYRGWIKDQDANLHWHDLRHEGATRLLLGGMSITAIQELLGHGDVATTRKYLNVTFQESAEQMKKVARKSGL